MSTYIISDLHLANEEQDVDRRLFNFLSTLKSQDKLIILGDLFDVWLGFDLASSNYLKVLSYLKYNKDRGIEIFFIAGNRDFLVEADFLLKYGIKRLPSDYVLKDFGKKLLLTHGDAYIYADRSYLRFRKIVQNRYVQKFFLSLPKKFRAYLGKKIQAASKKVKKKTLQGKRLQIDFDTVILLLEKYQADKLIYGHIHRAFDSKYFATLGAFENTLSFYKIDKNTDQLAVNNLQRF